MRLYQLTVAQADFIWNRNGTVYRIEKGVRYTYPVPYTAADFIEQRDGLAERRVINQFSKYSGYPDNAGKLKMVYSNPKKRAAKKKAVRKNPAGTMQAVIKRALNRYKKAGYLMTAAKREVKALRQGREWARDVDIVAAGMSWSAPKKKVTMRKAPAVVDHLITSTKRKRDAGDTKETKMVWFWEGIGWTTDTDKAARYHDPNQAQKIALLIVDNPKLHNANRRQMAVIEDAQHPQGELRSKRGSPGGK